MSLFEQSGQLPYDPDFEFPRKRVRLVNMIGSGAFGEVWLSQAYQISRLQARDKSEAACSARKKLFATKNISKKIEKDLEFGNKAEVVAIKKITGTFFIALF